MKTQKNTKHKRILIAVGFQPYPTLFGGAVDVWERVIGLKKLGHEVDMVFTEKVAPTEEDLKLMKQFVSNIYFVKRKNHWKQLFSSLPLQVLSRDGFKKIQFTQTYDIVIAEGEFCAQVVQNSTLLYKSLVVRIHNNEAFYFSQLKKSVDSFLKKAYYTLEVPKIEKYTAKVLQKANRLWYISFDEYQQSLHADKAVFLPVPINENCVDHSPVSQNKVLFVGALFMPNNIFALDWYLSHVHPNFIDRKGYELVVVGAVKSKDEERNIINKYGSLPKVTLAFNQNDLEPFYAPTKAFINPMFHGSGVKIKSVMALVNGLPLVSTNVGIEGMGLTDQMFWRANTAKEFILQLTEIFESSEEHLKNRVHLAQQHLEHNHYLKVLEKELA